MASGFIIMMIIIIIAGANAGGKDFGDTVTKGADELGSCLLTLFIGCGIVVIVIILIIILFSSVC